MDSPIHPANEYLDPHRGLVYNDFSKNTRKVRELWWHGVPPSVRGEVWRVAIGNQLNLTPGMCVCLLCVFSTQMPIQVRKNVRRGRLRNCGL